MTPETSTEWRADVVARGHGDHAPIPPGIERDAIDAVRFLGREGLSVDLLAGACGARRGRPACTRYGGGPPSMAQAALIRCQNSCVLTLAPPAAGCCAEASSNGDLLPGGMVLGGVWPCPRKAERKPRSSRRSSCRRERASNRGPRPRGR